MNFTRMKPSPEIKTLLQEWYRRISAGDFVDSAERMLAREADFLAIDSDGEWIEGREELIRAYRDTWKNGPPAVVVNRMEAYSEGSVGWAADVVTVKSPDGSEFQLRHSFVLHKEDGEWRVVHAHYSVGTPGERVGSEEG